MKNLYFLLCLCTPLFTFSQWYDGYGYFPINKTFTFDSLNTNYIKIPQNSAWQISSIGKIGLLNDSSKVIVTDTSSFNVRKGNFYFELKIPNYMITGDTSHFYNGSNSWGYDFSNYDVIIKHKHKISNSSSGKILFKNISENNYDTIKLNSNIWSPDVCYYPEFFENINNYTGQLDPWNNDFSYGDSITGTRDTQWVYTDLRYYFIAVKQLQTTCLYSSDYNYDTTSIRFIYNAPDSLSGGPGWMIKSIKFVTYQCTLNCPTSNNKGIIESNFINLFPNPASKYFKLSIAKNQSDRISLFKIYNSIGNEFKVYFKQEDKENYIFDINAYPTGLYELLIFENDKKEIIKKSFVIVN